MFDGEGGIRGGVAGLCLTAGSGVVFDGGLRGCV